MNHIFLSGIVEAAPVLLSKDKQTPHACMSLVVSHRNSAGYEKREIFPIHTWHNVARSLMKTVKPADRVSIKGYLCQHHMNNQTLLCITADEYHVSSKQPSRPMRRTEKAPFETAKADDTLSENMMYTHCYDTVSANNVDNDKND